MTDYYIALFSKIQVRRELECDRGVPHLFENRYSGLGKNLVSAIAIG